ncbi:MAG: hypothetical protein CMH57_14755 [Myxococcales bacterium]|nr:hypothetical protein [Myxococcales bacterium]
MRTPTHPLSTLVVSAAAALTCLLLSAVVCAQQPAIDPEKLLEEARLDLEAERYDDAIEKLLTVYNSYPSSKLLFNIAKTYEKKGDCHNALNYYLTAIDPDGAAESDEVRQPVFELFETFDCEDDDPSRVSASIDNLNRSLERFEALNPQGGAYAAILLPLARMTSRTPRCPDARQLFAKATRLAPDTDVSRAAIEEMQELECEVEPIIGDGPTGPTGPTDDGDDIQTWVAYGLMGAGVVTLATSGILLAANSGDVQTLNDLSGATDNQAFRDEGFNSASEFDTFKSDVESRQTWTTVLAVSSVALIGAGVTVYFWPTDGERMPPASDEPTSLRWSPWIDPVQGSVGGVIGWELD